MSNIEIEIDGNILSAKPTDTIIQVADEAGIYIPRFCYQKHLSIAANCRMCLVEVEKSPKALPACATPVMPGMKVFTKSQKTIDAQRAVMEFLLINHPLDCPICDQGGECELQDLSMGYGATTSHYDECKRAVPDQDLGPLIASDMTRCIYCTRCVRFGDEVAGMREMGATFRGEHTEIGTYVTHAIKSEVSGNIIDLCPVGALTSKPYRFTARAWELDQAPSISPHDCVGTNIFVHRRYGKVMRVVSRENVAINETWIADRDRFSYVGLDHADRLTEPMIRVNGEWQVVEWDKALHVASDKIHASIAAHGVDQVGVLASPNATLEEFYLLQKMARELGLSHVDHRLRATDTCDQADEVEFAAAAMPLAEIEQCDAVVVIGSNLQKEQPMAALRVRKAGLKNAAIAVINPMDYHFNFKVSAKKVIAPHLFVRELEALVASLQSDKQHEIAALLQGKQKSCVILGAFVQHHPEASRLRHLAKQIAILINAKLTIMTDGANSTGASLTSSLFNHTGMNAHEMLAKSRQAYVLLNVEPDRDCANAAEAIAAIKQASTVIALSMYRNPILEQHADVILPMAAFTETSGTFVNVEGVWQSFHGVANPVGAARPAWKILRVLANFLHVDGFDYESSEQVKHEVKTLLATRAAVIPAHRSHPNRDALEDQRTLISRIGEIPIYSTDSLVRRSEPLQKAQTIMEGASDVVRMHPDTASKLGLVADKMVTVKQGTQTATLLLCLDPRVAIDAAWIAGGVASTVGLGDLMGMVEVSLC